MSRESGIYSSNRQIIAEIKHKSDLLRTIGQSVRLRKQGRRWVGLCPFHQEKTPSFYVDPQEGFFKCFGCGEGGDIFSFLQKRTGQPFGDVLQQLAQQVGVTLPESHKRAHGVSSQLQHVLRLAGDFFTRCLAAYKDGPMDYLVRERGLNARHIARYGFGFCPNNADAFLAWLHQHNVSSQLAVQAGLIHTTATGPRAFFADRITIPLHNVRGAIVGFGARAWGSKSQKPKYLNSPTSCLYDKSSFLYGLPQALPMLKKGEPMVLVEGYFDVIALQSLHYAAVCACGTSLTSKQMELLRRFTSEIILCLDGDAAGQVASKKALLLLLQNGFRVRNACLQHSDPDQLYCSGQTQQLQQQIQQAPDAVEMLIRQTAENATMSPSQRLKQLDELLPFLAAPVRLLHVQQYIRLAAQLLGEDEKTLQQEIAAQRGGSKLHRARARTASPPATVPAWRETDDLLLQIFLHHPQLVSQCPQSVLQQSHNLLQGFVRDLTSILQQHDIKNPQDALRRVSIPAHSPLALLLVRAQQAGISPGIHEAEAILQQWEAKLLPCKKSGD